jgi:hypothetical protein
MNNKGGSLYLGISDSGVIDGIIMTNKSIDNLKLVFDGVYQKIIPSHLMIELVLKMDMFNVLNEKLVPIPNKYIIRITIPKSSEQIYAMDGYAYVRCLASCCRVTNKPSFETTKYKELENNKNQLLANMDNKYNIILDKYKQIQSKLIQIQNEYHNTIELYYDKKRQYEKLNKYHNSVIETCEMLEEQLLYTKYRYKKIRKIYNRLKIKLSANYDKKNMKMFNTHHLLTKLKKYFSKENMIIRLKKKLLKNLKKNLSTKLRKIFEKKQQST